MLELRRRGTVHVADRHGEGDEGGRHIEVFEGAGHGILASNGADPEVHLRHEGAEHGRKRFAPALWLVAQLLEILLEGEVCLFVFEARRREFRKRFDHRHVGARVLVAFHEEGVEAPRMAEAVVVSPNTGNLATMASAGVSCSLPPNGMSTVAAPIVESKRSDRPLLEAMLMSESISFIRSLSEPDENGAR